MMKTKCVPFKTRIGMSVSLAALAVALLGVCPAQAQLCQLYPIALSAQSLTNVTPGTVVSNIWNGSQPGNFGWLSWTGDPGETTLLDSLTQPGDSTTYVNPDNTNDHTLLVGDWVSGKPGVSNSKHVRAALDTLEGVQIVVPVWDQARGEGDNTAYHVSAFAVVQIISYSLPSQNQITAQFLGYSSCSSSTN
jgi:hypothetical protein